MSITKRTVKNRSGLDLFVGNSFTEAQVDVIAVTTLPHYKSAKHTAEDTIQLGVSRFGGNDRVI